MPRKWFRSDKKPPTGPVTVIGQYMLAVVLGDTGRAKLLFDQINGPAGGPESAFWLAAAELVAGRYFGSDYDVRAVTELAADARSLAVRQNLAVFSLLEIEAVYRSALGEDHVDVSGIRPVSLDKIRNSMVAFVILKQGWPESEIRDLVIQAEQIAFERGWHPRLAVARRGQR
jgi:hypothetical protein